MSDFAGAGGPPPKAAGGGGGGGRRYGPEHAFEEELTLKKDNDGNPYTKVVKGLKLAVGAKDHPVTMLDPLGQRYAVLVHDFKGRDGKFGNMVRCISRDEPRGCALCDALDKKAKWYWCLSCIDQSKFVPSDGANKGKVYTNFRRLVLVTEQQLEDIKSLELKDPGGFRGRTFDLSRSSDQKSYRIGTTWYPTGKMSEDQMKAAFAQAAEDYGLPVEDFIAPVKYATVIKAPSFEEMNKIAAEYKGVAPVPSTDTGDAAAVGTPADEEEITF